MFDAVLFDLDETLLQDEPVSRHAFFITALELTRDDARARHLAEVVEGEAKRLWKELPESVIQYATAIGHSAIEGLWATYDARTPSEAVLDRELTRLRPELWRRPAIDGDLVVFVAEPSAPGTGFLTGLIAARIDGGAPWLVAGSTHVIESVVVRDRMAVWVGGGQVGRSEVRARWPGGHRQR